jgi:acetoin utilization deacetylase AcuC-like enzyme
VSLHQYPFYPGTGGLRETGERGGLGATVNLPFPAGTPGDAYRLAFDEVVAPAADEFAPTWLLISAGFDAHRDDPLCELELTSGDFADLTTTAMSYVSPGRVIAFLEGGYDLASLGRSAAATVAALCGVRYRPEDASRDEVPDLARVVIAGAASLHRSARFF